MKNCAIVCEYNPFHTGHKYQLDVVRGLGFANIFCVMSGSFVQSGLPAFCDKSIRAECAIKGGANAVIELPSVYSTASAQAFAEGGLKIISDIKNISHLAMGAVGNDDDILRVAEIKIKHANEFTSVLKRQLDKGKSYNAATAAALSGIYGKLYPDRTPIDALFNDPNNILCIEYISAINKYCANVQPLILQRKGALYNDCDTDCEYISATAIRNAADNVGIDTVQKYVPYNYDKICDYRRMHSPDIEMYKALALFALKRARPNDITNLRNCSEGMEYLLKNAVQFSDLDKVIDAVTGKRYGKKRIFRLILDLLLNIDKTLTHKQFCTRLLACKSDFDFSLLPSCVKSTNADIKNAAKDNADIKSVLQVDIDATALYNTLCRKDGDYFNYSVIKV